MNIIKVEQGSDAWKAHRAKYFNASDAPSMMGVSKYKTRDQLLRERATGIVEEPDERTQALFDEGHHFEALARPEAEKIVDDDLQPLTATLDSYSSSFDGITFDEQTLWEHKRINDALRACDSAADLPIMYRVQMEQQLMIAGGKRCLFMATMWNEKNENTEMMWFWYHPDLELRAKILAGWEQFESDVKNWKPTTAPEVITPELVTALPVPAVIAEGRLINSNIADIAPKFDRYLDGVKTDLETDQDFADAEENGKSCRTTAKKLKALQSAVVDQMSTVSEVIEQLKTYETRFNKMGLTLEKQVKAEKDRIKEQAITDAVGDYHAHVQQLESQLPVSLGFDTPSFADAIKGVRLVSSMKSRINDALAEGKATANMRAKEYVVKLGHITPAIEGHEHLFNLQSLVGKDLDFIKLHIKSVIAEEKARQDKVAADALAAKEAQEQAEAQAEAAKKAAPPVEQEPVAETVAADPAPSPAKPAQMPESYSVKYNIAPGDAVQIVTTINANVSNSKLSDADFRLFVSNTLSSYLNESAA